MKIACISASQIPSSTANSIQAMKACQGLAQLGHEVHLLAPGAESCSFDELADHYGLITSFQVERLPSRANLKRYDFSLVAVRRARKIGSDVVYAWPPQAALFALAYGMPTLLELHGEPEGRLGPFVFQMLLNQGGRRRFLPITQALADRIGRSFNWTWREGELVVSPNGVDLERYQDLQDPPSARRALNLPETLTVAYTGHLYPGRGMSLLVKLAKRLPEVSFLWVGGRSSDVEAWKQRLLEAGVNNVTLTGFVTNTHLPQYQAAADLLLMPYERSIAGSSGGNSAAYASPMKMFEYMASGRALITSDLPVIREVPDESNAAFCPPEDVDAWEGQIRRLIANPQERHALGAQARRDAERYTWKERASRALDGFDAS